MQGYRIIQEDKQYYFILLPQNNSNQEVGYSPKYNSKEECIKAVATFRKIVIDNEIDSIDSPLIEIVKTDKGIYFRYKYNDKIVFQSRTYNCEPYECHCKKRIKSIYNQIYEYTSKEV